MSNILLNAVTVCLTFGEVDVCALVLGTDVGDKVLHETVYGLLARLDEIHGLQLV